MEGDQEQSNAAFNTYTALTNPILQLIQQANKTDTTLQQVHHQAAANQLPRSYSVKGDLIYYDRILVPNNDLKTFDIAQVSYPSRRTWSHPQNL